MYIYLSKELKIKAMISIYNRSHKRHQLAKECLVNNGVKVLSEEPTTFFGWSAFMVLIEDNESNKKVLRTNNIPGQIC